MWPVPALEVYKLVSFPRFFFLHRNVWMSFLRDDNGTTNIIGGTKLAALEIHKMNAALQIRTYQV